MRKTRQRGRGCPIKEKMKEVRLKSTRMQVLSSLNKLWTFEEFSKTFRWFFYSPGLWKQISADTPKTFAIYLSYPHHLSQTPKFLYT